MKKTYYLFLLLSLLLPLKGFPNHEEDFRLESLNYSIHKMKPNKMKPKSLPGGEYKAGGCCNDEYFSVTFPSKIETYTIKTYKDCCFYTLDADERFWEVEEEFDFDLEYANRNGNVLTDYSITTFKGMPALEYSYIYEGSSGDKYLLKRFKVISESNVYEVKSFCGVDESPSHFDKVKESLVIY